MITNILRLHEDPARCPDSGDNLERLLVTQTCPECHGERLRPESRLVTVAGRTIVQVSRLPLIDLAA